MIVLPFSRKRTEPALLIVAVRITVEPRITDVPPVMEIVTVFGAAEGLMVNVKVAVSEPTKLFAVIVSNNEVAVSDGVPDITPVVVSKDRPDGRLRSSE